MYGDYSLKQYNTVECFRCYFHSFINGESMARKVLKNQPRLGFFLNYFRRLKFNVRIQLPVDYRCTSWYPTKSLKIKMKIAKNKKN